MRNEEELVAVVVVDGVVVGLVVVPYDATVKKLNKWCVWLVRSCQSHKRLHYAYTTRPSVCPSLRAHRQV